MFAPAHSGASRVAILGAQGVKPRRRRFSHAGIKLHFRGLTLFGLRFCQRQGPGSQFKIVAVRFDLGPTPGIAHSILEIGRSAPDPPPPCFRFQQISERVIGPFLFQTFCGFYPSLEVERIDFVEDGGCLRRQIEVGGAPGDA